jgi:hypothetical protein
MWEAFQPIARERIESMADAVADPRVVPISSARRHRRWSLAVAVPAAAAVFALAIFSRPEPSFPSYSIALAGGWSPTRAAPGEEAASWTPTAPFALTLKPATPVGLEGERPAFRGFLRVNQAVQPWRVAHEVSTSGAIKIQGTAGDLLGTEPGPRELILWVGREADAPAELPGEGATSGQIFRVSLVMQAD